MLGLVLIVPQDIQYPVLGGLHESYEQEEEEPRLVGIAHTGRGAARLGQNEKEECKRHSEKERKREGGMSKDSQTRSDFLENPNEAVARSVT